MASFIGEEHQSSDSGSVDVGVPAGTQDGDVIVAALWYDNGNTIDPPSGWTEISSAASVNFSAARMFYRVASSEPSDYTWTRASGSWAYGVTHATFRDLDTSSGDPVAAFAKSTDGNPDSTETAPSVTTSDIAVILTFASSYRESSSGVINNDSPNGGTEISDFGTEIGGLANSGALYFAERDPGQYGFSVTFSGGGLDSCALFTVALAAGGVSGDASVTAPFPGVSASGGIVAEGSVSVSAPLALMSYDALTNLVRIEMEITAPSAVATLLSDSNINGPIGITAPHAEPVITGVHDVLVDLAAQAPAPVLLMGAETRIFGARIVVVRAETRVRLPL